ncbi:MULTISPECIES: non-ribosomal peptide synthetase [Streptomyces]|uniref:Amino acid adenylation domain-containing protein n=1 Tax=Streptomyces siderophoricus TaxID=2802281 RepID=A0ABS1MV02_9ACTN|nr:amino acid adenylation domain-containing protein [Streptomyces sp. 9-7]MBL1091628.1 amino acid adenylation domain-containing protein [Streptomyces sp. 9-7]
MSSHAAQLPADRPRGVDAPACTAVVRQEIPGLYDDAVRALAASCATTPENVLLAGFAALVYRCSGQNQVEFRLVREGGKEALLRFSVTGDSTLRGLAGEAGAVARPGAEPARLGVRIGAPPADGDPRPYEAELALPVPDAGSRWAALHFDDRLFAPATAQRILGHYGHLLHDGLCHPDRPLARLTLLTEAEQRRVLLEWNDTAVSLPHEGACLHEVFEERVRQAPEAVAVVQGTARRTFREINAAANRLARHLRDLGVGPDDRVGLFLDHSPELLIAMLGVLKAGGAYVPLDPAYPRARLTTMISGASCVALISRTGLADALGSGADAVVRGQLILLDRDEAILAERPTDDLEPVAGPDNLCYVIHTSGSTGRPKPIALRHRGVLNNIADLNTRFAVGPGDSVLGLSSPSFDMSVYEFLGMTAAGGTLVLPAPGRGKEPAHWAELAAEHGVTVWNTAPALLELVLDHLDATATDGPSSLGSLRLIMLAGDWIPVKMPDRTREFAPDARFISLGGATEASIYSTLYEVEATDPGWTSIPYGRPMANQRTYVLDEALQPVPPGVTGELYLAGDGLAVGYLDLPDLTAERFLHWSYGPVSDERLYRTGDLARCDADGLIELLGRTDLQVKIHGLRVELTEIESVLRDHPRVKEAAVAAQPDATGAPVLVGYVVPREGEAIDPDEVRDRLAARLPAHMVPGTVLVLSAMPLSPNGKLDRKALPGAPSPHDGGRGGTVPADAAPSGPWEERIAAAWCEVLGVEAIGRDDDFFRLGGDSMKALRSMTQVPEITLVDLYRHSTLRLLAAHLEATAGGPGAAERSPGPDAAV